MNTTHEIRFVETPRKRTFEPSEPMINVLRYAEDIMPGEVKLAKQRYEEEYDAELQDTILSKSLLTKTLNLAMLGISSAVITYKKPVKQPPSQKHRGKLYRALKGFNLSTPIENLVGCSLLELKAHIEKQFIDGMSWENYGSWHCDHARPVASYDLDDHEQLLQCFNYKNLQPLWAADNIKKGAQFIKV